MMGGLQPRGIKPKKQRIWAEENYGRGKPRPVRDALSGLVKKAKGLFTNDKNKPN